MNIAIIPARSGSKRIKNKNIKIFNGKPIIYWSIKSLLDSKIFDKIIVSTDSKKIAKIAIKYGAETPFLRPKKYSTDHSTTREVIEHAINFLEKQNYDIDAVACVYPTSVLIGKNDLKNAYKLFLKNKKKYYVFSALKFSYPVQRGFYIRKNKVVALNKKNLNKRSQDLENIFHDAGKFYFFTKKMIKKKINIFSKFSYPIKIDELKAQDIDNYSDWKLAEIKHKHMKKN